MNDEIENFILAMRDVPNNDLHRIILNVYNYDINNIDKIKSIKRSSTLHATRIIDIVKKSIEVDTENKLLREKIALINAKAQKTRVRDDDEIDKLLAEKAEAINRKAAKKVHSGENVMNSVVEKLYKQLVEYYERHGLSNPPKYVEKVEIEYGRQCYQLYQMYKEMCIKDVGKCIDLRIQYIKNCANNSIDYSHLQHLVHLFNQYYR